MATPLKSGAIGLSTSGYRAITPAGAFRAGTCGVGHGHSLIQLTSALMILVAVALGIITGGPQGLFAWFTILLPLTISVLGITLFLRRRPRL
jgi:hypothetical protein